MWEEREHSQWRNNLNTFNQTADDTTEHVPEEPWDLPLQEGFLPTLKPHNIGEVKVSLPNSSDSQSLYMADIVKINV